MQSISELPFKQVVTVGTGDGLLVDPHEHLIKMAVFIISTLALHYIKDGERGTLKCKASYLTAKIYSARPKGGPLVA